MLIQIMQSPIPCSWLILENICLLRLCAMPRLMGLLTSTAIITGPLAILDAFRSLKSSILKSNTDADTDTEAEFESDGVDAVTANKFSGWLWGRDTMYPGEKYAEMRIRR